MKWTCICKWRLDSVRVFIRACNVYVNFPIVQAFRPSDGSLTTISNQMGDLPTIGNELDDLDTINNNVCDIDTINRTD